MRNSELALWFLVLASVLVVTSPVARAQCQYEVHVIAMEGNCHVDAAALNDHGEVVGAYHCGIGQNQPFRWTEAGGMELVDPPPGCSNGSFLDVNNLGHIVGQSCLSPGPIRGFVLEDGVYTELPPAAAGSSTAIAINDAGVVVGCRFAEFKGGPAPNAFVWTRECGFVDLGLMGRWSSEATDVNAHGKVVGSRRAQDREPFEWEDGELDFLPLAPGTQSSSARSVNNRGEIGGSGDGTAWIWSGGGYRIIEPVVGTHRCACSAINDVAQAVGKCLPDDTNDAVGILWQNGNTYDLNEISVVPLGFLIEEAEDINAHGWIVAQGHDPSRGVSYLLKPIAAPGDVTLDCVVDFADVLFVLSDWGRVDSPADLTGDGTVDFADLLFVLTNWT